MFQVLRNALLVGPAVLGASLMLSTAAAVAEPVVETSNTQPSVSSLEPASNNPATKGLNIQDGGPSAAAPLFDSQMENPGALTDPAGGDAIAQVTSVSQLSDVDTSSWAFQSLQSLIERYGCIAGYPDGTFRGNRALTRYEFAAGLYACLNSLAERIQGLSPDELASLRRLQDEFAAELATLRGQVDSLEARTTELEENQFSTTSKLTGEVIFLPSYVFGGGTEDGDDDVAGVGDDDDLGANEILGYRARLNFDTSFFGTDRLRVRLNAGDNARYDQVPGASNMTRLNVDTDTNGSVTIDDLYYRFNLGDRTQIYIAATETEFYDGIETFSVLESEGQGALSRFARFNPIYRQQESGTGAIINFDLSDKVTASVAYLADGDSAVTPVFDEDLNGGGLFGGGYGALAQLGFAPSDNFGIGLTYVRSYAPTGGNLGGDTGSDLAEDPFGGAATSANAFGVQAQLDVSDRFAISAWGGYTLAYAENGTDGNADLLNYAVTLGFPDLGKEGNLGAITFGQPPRIVGGNVDEDPDTSYHIEALYRFRVSDNISITPGAYVILNPEHNSNNDPVYVGVIRTTFNF